MAPRRKSRETVIKILYQADLDTNTEIDEVLDQYLSDDIKSKDLAQGADSNDFIGELVSGVSNNQVEIDYLIEKALDNWTLSRLGYLERAILRLGCFEIAYWPDTPDKVAIHEAVELAKTFCEEDSCGLVNGVLDKIMKDKNAVP